MHWKVITKLNSDLCFTECSGCLGDYIWILTKVITSYNYLLGKRDAINELLFYCPVLP